MHINPDFFLETPTGRVVTPERNAAAWSRSFEALENALRRLGPRSAVYLLVGAQGSGKTTWARARTACEHSAVVFDAVLATGTERRAVMELTERYKASVTAVWLQTTLDECLARNAAQPADKRVHEQAVRNVHAALEPPTLEEGFVEVLTVPAESAPARG
jgi:predicted kinase